MESPKRKQELILVAAKTVGETVTDEGQVERGIYAASVFASPAQ